jgi:hypothetical protein
MDEDGALPGCFIVPTFEGLVFELNNRVPHQVKTRKGVSAVGGRGGGGTGPRAPAADPPLAPACRLPTRPSSAVPRPPQHLLAACLQVSNDGPGDRIHLVIDVAESPRDQVRGWIVPRCRLTQLHHQSTTGTN